MPVPPIFEGLNDIDAATAKRRFKTHRVAFGGEVMTQGGPSKGLVIVVEGELEVVVDGSVVGKVGPGSMIGEMGLFNDAPRTATVRAPEGALVWALDRQGYEELRDTLHPICITIERATIDAQVRRLLRVGRRVAMLGLGQPSTTKPQSGFFQAVQRLFGGGDVTPVKASALEGLIDSTLFAGAPLPAMEQMAQWFGVMDAKAGAFLCTEGEVGDKMFVLQKGSVEVLMNVDGPPHQVATLHEGAAFGMVSLAGARERMSSCVAREPCRVLVLDQHGWNQLVHEPYMVGSTFRRAVIRAFSDQLRYSNAQLAEWEHGLSDYGLEAIRNAQRGLTSHDRSLFGSE